MIGNPLSSWSASYDTGKEFALNGASNHYVLWASVPRERVWSTWATGPGCVAEHEAAILGLDDEIYIEEVHPDLVIQGQHVYYPEKNKPEAASDKPVYIDGPEFEDWPKRTPDFFPAQTEKPPTNSPKTALPQSVKTKHYGPGDHPGTGTPQSVHGRSGGHTEGLPRDTSPLPSTAQAEVLTPLRELSKRQLVDRLHNVWDHTEIDESI